MEIFKKIAGAFVEFDNNENIIENDNSKNKTDKVSNQENQNLQNTENNVTSVENNTDVSQNQDDNQVQKENEVYPHLLNCLYQALAESKDILHPGYLELSQAVNNEITKKVIPDKNTRFITSYITLKLSNANLNKDTLLTSISNCIDCINNEKIKAQEELEKVKKQTITEREELIAKNEETLKNLQQQLTDLLKNIAETKNELVNAQVQYTNNNDTLNYTVNDLIGKIEADKIILEKIITD